MLFQAWDRSSVTDHGVCAAQRIRRHTLSDGDNIPRVHLDRSHGEFPVHADVTVPLDNMPMAHKIRVDGQGQVLSDELTFPNDLSRLDSTPDPFKMPGT